MTLFIHNYHPVSNDYLNTEEADLDPIDNLPIIPGSATDIDVITVPAGHVAVFNGSGWDDVEDNRGVVYETATARKTYFNILGVLPPELTKLVPVEFDVWVNSNWVNDIELRKESHKSEMEAARDIEILKPVASSALGPVHAYNTNRDFRQDLNDQLTLQLGGYLTCIDLSNIKARKAHTHDQLMSVAQAMFSSIQAAHDLYETKLVLINNATNQAELNAVVW